MIWRGCRATSHRSSLSPGIAWTWFLLTISELSAGQPAPKRGCASTTMWGQGFKAIPSHIGSQLRAGSSQRKIWRRRRVQRAVYSPDLPVDLRVDLIPVRRNGVLGLLKRQSARADLFVKIVLNNVFLSGTWLGGIRFWP